MTQSQFKKKIYHSYLIRGKLLAFIGFDDIEPTFLNIISLLRPLYQHTHGTHQCCENQDRNTDCKILPKDTKLYTKIYM